MGLLSAIELAEALATQSSELSDERAKAMDYYLGKPMGNEVKDRSQVVSRDVQDTIEWIKPALMRIFHGGDSVVQFNPHGPEDVEAAEQETDYVNYIVQQKNNGFLLSYTWITDALLSKNSYVKVIYEEGERNKRERYQGLTEDQLALLAKDSAVEIVFAQKDEQGLYTVVLQKKEEYGCVKAVNIPPERCLTSHSLESISLEHADFFEHWEWRTLSDLRDEGYKLPDNIGSDDWSDAFENEEQARNVYADLTSSNDDDIAERRYYRVREVWIKFDEDGDGINELIHAILVGRTILTQEEAEFIPIACITPTIMPHRHVGRSIADAVSDLQVIKSVLLRQMLDNLYLVNNQRNVVSDQVNLDDMLTSRPGGLVRLKPGAIPSQGHVMPMETQFVGAQAFPMLEYLDQVREARTGTSRYNQGLDQNSLNKTATGVTAIMGAAQQRIELIARIFAETGYKELYRIIHAMSLKHARQADVVKLRNKWVTVDPRQWVTRADMTISVGLGTGNKDQMLMHLMQISAAQVQAIQMGGLDQIVTLKNVYNTQKRIAENAGFKNAEEYWTDPENAPPQQPKPNPELDLKMREVDIKEFDAETKRMQVTGSLDQAQVAQEHQALTEAQRMEQEQMGAQEGEEKHQQVVQAVEQTSQGVQEFGQQLLQSLEGFAQQVAQAVQSMQEQNAQAQQENAQNMAQIADGIQSIASFQRAPKRVVRGKDGSIAVHEAMVQ